MKCVARDPKGAFGAEVVALSCPGDDTSHADIALVVMTCDVFKRGDEERGNRRLSLGGDDLHLLEEGSRYRQRDVLSLHDKECSTIIRAVREADPP